MSGIASSLISGALGLISGIIGNRSTTNNVKRQIAAQQEENAKTREHNLMLAKQQNAWNVEQYEREQRDYLNNWNMQNEYDAPSAQMERLKLAGLNPNLALGSMSDSGTISTSSAAGSMTAGAPAQSADMSALGRLPTIGDAIQTGLDSAMKEAQIEAIRANTGKVKSETEGVNLDNKVKASTVEIETALKQGELTMRNLEIKGLTFDIDKLRPEQLKRLTAEINNTSASATKTMQEVNNLREQLKGLTIDNAIKEIDRKMKSPMMIETLKNMAAQRGLTIQQAREISQLLSYKIVGFEKSNELIDKQIQNAVGQYRKTLQEIRGMTIGNDRVELEYAADYKFLNSSSRNYTPESFIHYVGLVAKELLPLSFKLGK